MFYWVVKAILGPVLAVLWQPRAEGVENVPRHGPAIMVSNHLSFSDHFFGPLPLPRKITFLAKAEYFTGKGVKGLASRLFFTGVGQIPIDRSGGKASEAALRTGLKVLRQGKLLGIYPEGTRSPDGKLYRGRTGVARLALESGAPVVPMAMINVDKIMPPGRTVPKLGIRPKVVFGKPLDFSRYEGMEKDPRVLRAITDEIMYALMELSGQEYVDRYAQSVKAELEAAAREGRKEQHADRRERRRAARETRKAERAKRRAERRAVRAEGRKDSAD
ncbi:lysophospholipid acyltransferase family protein [Marinitenerispora sediminis]|uniref:1-acyl-sn-glycerol-3-phosphate acyltransferase n=1 Tax=Marinitenerispora sediminis TaxID=1931232 RepID=A0A368TBZ3_9ACTN|nr:lysophospholipid acyltransferase family protein [Marinitenerispora sediminis]RCV55289.1 1-acyl-sn-glycerol-3-phosphate acyltransferase [Marinitenerispora sediminis]RCV61606.1 1-acyl-sn-glycerol-3-phosphate acyltransferase [Marinitenerispora sediminis]RCV62663.1 1-acyl-sn-glycerol-3-phosphate acyltransferase [Marinitenerispora sediminis]